MTPEDGGVSVVIPVYNESENIIPLYEEIAHSLKDIIFEVIFIDDGSNDDTKKYLNSIISKNCRVISHKINYGQSAALLSGVKYAKNPIIITMDGDGQNDPADIPQLLKLLQNNTAVLGLRRKRHDNLLRKISSRVGNNIRKFLLQDDCLDTGCSLKAFYRADFLSLPAFNHMHRYLPALFKRAGISLTMLKVNHRPRNHGVSKYGVLNRLFVGIHDLFGMRWLIKRNCIAEIVNDSN